MTSESWERAFGKIFGICRVTRQSKDDPDLRELYFIRGILRNRLSYFDNGQGLQYLKNARSWGVPIETLRSIAYETRSWTSFRGDIGEAIEETEAGREEHTTDVEPVDGEGRR